MRLFAITLTAFMLTNLSARAQQAPQTPAAPPANDAALDGHLKKWEGAMKNVETLGARLTRIDKDRTFDQVRQYEGEAYYLKAGTGTTAQNLAILEMRPQGKKEFKERFVCTGTFIYHFLPEQKEIRYYELPKPKAGQVGEDSLLSLLFGMKSDEAKSRYELKLYKEDANYVYVDIAPRSATDKSDFQRARLILNKSNYLPRRLWFEHANGNEVTWDMPNVQIGMKLDRRYFDAPQAPPGWKIVAGETKREPVVRPAAPTPPAGK